MAVVAWFRVCALGMGPSPWDTNISPICPIWAILGAHISNLRNLPSGSAFKSQTPRAKTGVCLLILESNLDPKP